MRPKNFKPSKRWAWLPALLVITGSIVTAAGISLIPSATAANPEPVIVTGTVGATLNITPTCGGGTVALGAFAGLEVVSNAECTMTFDTNNGNGAKLEVLDDDAVAPFFCNNGGATCGLLNEFDNVGYVAAGAALGVGDFGVALESVGGATPTATWTVDSDTAAASGDASFYPIEPASGANTEACRSNANTVGTDCEFEFGGEPKAAQTADIGTGYQGTARFIATTLP